MDLRALGDVLTAEGPFVTVHVPSESAVEQAGAAYELAWRDVARELEGRGLDPEVVEAVTSARGAHDEGASRFVVASARTGKVELAVSLGSPAPRTVVEVGPLPRLMPLVADVTARVPHVVVLVDRTGADVSAWYDTETAVSEVTVEGHAVDIRKVKVGGWAHLHYHHRAENGWQANAREIVSEVDRVAEQLGAELIVGAGDERELTYVREYLPERLKGKWVEVQGTRGGDGSEDLVRERVANAVARFEAEKVLSGLEGFAEGRGRADAGEPGLGCDGVEQVVEALRMAQVQTLLVTTDVDQQARLFFGPEPTQLGLRREDVEALGVAAEQVQEGPLVDVLLRAALGTSADVQLVPHEMDQSPRGGVGAVLRFSLQG